MAIFIRNIYKDLLKSEWTFKQIEEADIFYLIDVLFGEDEQPNQTENVVCIDQIPGF